MLATYLLSPATLLKSALLYFILASHCYAEPSKVLVSIKPLHSLISHITEGINPTKLLLSQQQSAHHFQLKPSQKRLLNQADILFYSSDTIEAFVPAISRSSGKHLFIELARTPGLQTLSARGFDAHEHQHEGNPAATVQHNDENIDGHIWLSVANAQHISRYVASILIAKNPAYASQYQHNLSALLKKLQHLKTSNQALLNNIKQQPFLLYHDAFQYLEAENQLSGAHFVTTSPEHTPGIKRIQQLKRLIEQESIQCIFYEPPNIPSLIKTLTENTDITLAALDPIGSQLPAGKQQYFELMQQTAHTLVDCLSSP